MTWGAHISLAPTWFDPAETSGIITPFMLSTRCTTRWSSRCRATRWRPSLAESWSISPDGLVYDFVLRKGAKFHNGDPVTAEDVKFSLRALPRGVPRPLKESVAAVETPDPGRVRIRLKRPWPDFMTFYLRGHRRRLDRAQEVRREGRRRGVQEGARRRRPLQVRLVHPGCGARPGGLRAVLAEGAEREAARLEGRSPTRPRAWPR